MVYIAPENGFKQFGYIAEISYLVQPSYQPCTAEAHWLLSNACLFDFRLLLVLLNWYVKSLPLLPSARVPVQSTSEMVQNLAEISSQCYLCSTRNGKDQLVKSIYKLYSPHYNCFPVTQNLYAQFIRPNLFFFFCRSGSGLLYQISS